MLPSKETDLPSQNRQHRAILWGNQGLTRDNATDTVRRMHIAFKSAVLTALLTACVSSALAQYGGYGGGPRGAGEMPDPTLREDAEGRMPMKKPSFLKRPDRATPAEQLAYADWLTQEKWGEKAALKAYRNLVHAWHESPEAVTAQLAYAKLLEKMGDYVDAFDEYQYLIEYFAGRFPYEEVLDRQFRIASEVMTRRRWKFFFMPGFKSPDRALPMFDKIAENAPKWKKAAVARFLVGLIHEENRDYEEAVRAYETIPYDYPDSEHAASAAFRRADCLRILAEKHPRDERSIRTAVTALAGFLRDYPKDERHAEAQKHRDALLARLEESCLQRAHYYDYKAHRPRAALIAYDTFIKTCPWSDRLEEVAKRMEALREIVEAEGESDE